MGLQAEVALGAKNTLAVPAVCAWYMEVRQRQQLQEAVAFARQKKLPVLVLGEGSNVVLPDYYPGLVIRNCLSGFHIHQGACSSESIIVELGAGENWHQAVLRCHKQQAYGLENLALIPGSCGAAPIQNIGAYGRELSDFLLSVSYFDFQDNAEIELGKSELRLGYRDSIFKNALRYKGCVTSVRVRLSSDAMPCLDYPSLAQAIDEQGVPVNHGTILDTVCAIRSSKLPCPKQRPNAGSFFKNPELQSPEYLVIKQKYPAMPGYPGSADRIKIPAAWLIEQCGWRGRKHKGLCMSEAHALVLINPNRTSAEAILSFASEIIDSVRERFDIQLEIEPAVVSVATGWQDSSNG